MGLAWNPREVSEEPPLSRSVLPAWSNRNPLSMARVVRSDAILANQMIVARPDRSVDLSPIRLQKPVAERREEPARAS